MAFLPCILIVNVCLLIFLCNTQISESIRIPNRESIIDVNTSTSSINAISDLHDLLPKYGFPKGLIPNAVKSYSLSDGDGDGSFWIELERPCYVHFSDLVYYDSKISGKLTYGSVSDVSGIQAKKLFVWLPVTAINLDSKPGFIDFFVGPLSKQFPAKEFESIPKCGYKASLPKDEDEDEDDSHPQSI